MLELDLEAKGPIIMLPPLIRRRESQFAPLAAMVFGLNSVYTTHQRLMALSPAEAKEPLFKFIAMACTQNNTRAQQWFPHAEGQRLLHAIAPEHVEVIVEFLCEAARDPVANVRFTAVRALETCSKHAGDEAVSTHIRPLLDSLKEDGDDDVRAHVASAAAAL